MYMPLILRLSATACIHDEGFRMSQKLVGHTLTVRVSYAIFIVPMMCCTHGSVKSKVFN